MAAERKIVKIATVVSAKMAKTIVVEVERQFKHPLYKKIVRSHKKFKVHDENNECRPGDRVLIEESRPLSRDKHFVLKEILERSK